MQNKIFCVWLLLTVWTTEAESAKPVSIAKSDLVHPADGMPGELSCEKEINLCRGVKLAAKIEVTAKGNGTLTIGKLKVAVLDDHNDGAFYEDEMLKTDFVDGDGFLDLVLSGIICFTDEKGDKVVRREAFVSTSIAANSDFGRFIPVLISTLQFVEIGLASSSKLVT
ncbi:MAG: hypothetical protein DME23_22315 [Verrucomicrobia bacterium]|nr:MAG: hypothetical protein DME23_22315 [Verrucomicrobiota bacterium]